MSSHIHKTALVDAKAHLGERVRVGPFAIIEAGAVLGDDCVVEAHAIVKASARLGNEVSVGHFSVIGGNPQHLSFEPDTPSLIEVGSKVRIGEGVTVHRSMYEHSKTVIGESSFPYVVLTSLTIVPWAGQWFWPMELCWAVTLTLVITFIGGGAGVHQFVNREGVMVGGLAEISADVAPQVMVAGRNRTRGLNLVGLRRRKVSKPEISELKKLYRSFLMKPGNLSERAKEFLKNDSLLPSQTAREFVEFFLDGGRGFARSEQSKG